MRTIEEDASKKKKNIELSCSGNFMRWMRENELSLAFTTYQTNRMFLVGLREDDKLSTFERLFDRPMGLYVDQDRMYLSTRYQIWRFDNTLPSGEKYKHYDALYVPRVGYTTADLDVHDLAPGKDGNLYFINTRYGCLSTLSEKYSFKPIWTPPFISKLTPEDRCHLNGLAMRDGMPRYTTAVSKSDVVGGWRNRRHDGGVVMDIATNDILCTGLAMPHSPRYYQGKLWVLNSGHGEFGYVDPQTGKFECVAFLPGYLRGLSFYENYAIIGLSKPRHERTFSGLPLDEKLKAKDADARCGLMVVDINSGMVLHWLEIEGKVVELYDVQVIKGARAPMALGFKSDEISRFVAIEEEDKVSFHPLASLDDPDKAKKEGEEDDKEEEDSFAGNNNFHMAQARENQRTSKTAQPLTRESSTQKDLNIGKTPSEPPAVNGYQFVGRTDVKVAEVLKNFEALTFPRLSIQLSSKPIQEPLVFVGAEQNKKLVGGLLAEIMPEGGLRVFSLFVQKEHRNKGIARRLLFHLEQAARQYKVPALILTYRTDWPNAPWVEKILERFHWPKAQTHLMICKTNVTKMTSAPWFSLEKYPLPAEYEMFLWKELTTAERKHILERKQKENWYPDALNPFQFEERIEWANSLGLRYKGEVIGWMITHKVQGDFIQYTSLFISPERQNMGRSLSLVVKAVQLQDERCAIKLGGWQVQPHNDQMMRFVERRMRPYLLTYTETKIAIKKLI